MRKRTDNNESFWGFSELPLRRRGVAIFMKQKTTMHT